MKPQLKPGIPVKVFHKAELYGRLVDIQGSKARVQLEGRKKPESFHVEQVQADDEPVVIGFENQFVDARQDPTAPPAEPKVYTGSLYHDLDELEAEAVQQVDKGLNRIAVHEYRLTAVYDVDPARSLAESRASVGDTKEMKEG